jgi:hypothetical protein
MNDHACLGPTTDQIAAEIANRNPAIVALVRVSPTPMTSPRGTAHFLSVTTTAIPPTEVVA